MPQKQYTVQAPDGRTITLEGPDGASQDEVIAQAQRLMSEAPAAPKMEGVQSGGSSTAGPPGPGIMDMRVPGMPSPRDVVQAGKGLIGLPKDLSQMQMPSGGEMLKTLIPGYNAAKTLGGAAQSIAEAPGNLVSGDPYRIGQGANTALMLAGVGKAAAGAIKGSLPANITAPKVNEWMGVSFRDVMHGADPGAQLLKDGLLGATKEQTLTKIVPARKAVGQLMDVKFAGAQQAGVTIDAEKTVLDALQNASKRIGRKTDKAFQGQLSNILDDILNDYPNLDKLPPKQAHQLKVDIGDSAKWKGSAYEDDLNQVFRDIYSGLNKDIKTNVKGIAADQEQWGNLYQAEKSLTEGIAKDQVGAGTGKRPPTKLRQGARLLGKAGIGAAIGAGAVSAGSKLID